MATEPELVDEGVEQGSAEPAAGAPPPAPGVTRRRRDYWQATSLAELAREDFRLALEQADEAGMRRAFYLLAGYYGRTLRILNGALANGREELAVAAMQNLVTLHRPLATMHAASPHIVPITLTLDREARDGFVRDLTVRVLSEAPEGLDVASVAEGVGRLDLVTNVKQGTVERHLRNLVASGHAERQEGRYRRATRPYTELDLSAYGLKALVGAELHQALAAAGFKTLADAGAERSAFGAALAPLTGLGETGLARFHEVVATLEDAWSERLSPWRHADLTGSAIPRPYQYEAYAMFRGGGYRGLIVEAPTGSGKTLIGQMCIQDWLRTLKPGQSVLVLVPTSNYQQQWIGELCYLPFGLRLSPEVIFAGTPTELERFQQRTGQHPAVLLMTYTALAQAGSGIGKGGFDVDSIEIFLQAANVQHVILDEVHKVVEDLRSVSADVTRLLVGWLEDTSLHGLIGFSGTAEAYRARFEALGLRLVTNISLEDLIAYGYVAPFAEFGVPFSNSARERQVRDLLDAYKERLRDFFALVGARRLRQLFGQVPLGERVAIARDLLDMARGDKARDQTLSRKMTEWAEGSAETLNVADARLVTILQIARGWSDRELAQAAGADEAAFEALLEAVEAIRRELAGLIYLPHTVAQLGREGFGVRFAAAELRVLPGEALSQAARAERVAEALATTIVGLYHELAGWYRRVGEGRVETIKAVIEAERAVRTVRGTIVFDNARRIRWQGGAVPAPGYEGVGGLFAQMLGDKRFLPMAVLSNEMYIGYRDEAPLPPRIAAHIEERLMKGEIASAIFSLVTQGLALEPEAKDALEELFHAQVEAYVPTLRDVRAVRPGAFSRRVLGPVRRDVKRRKLGAEGERLLMRLDLRNIHLMGLVGEFFDYAILARGFREARVARLEQVSGAIEPFFVVPMKSGNRKQLMYDLTARVVDADELGVNLVIVSNWARTGWNVLKPNLLLDATATRDVTAWQQLRGRAIRSLRSWTNDCYRLMLLLVGPRAGQFADREDLPEDVARAFEAAERSQNTGGLDDTLLALLEDIVPADLAPAVAQGGLDGLDEAQRTRLAVELMRRRNKVTHIYELVKAFGSTSQVTYDRARRRWQRREHIALKHANEVSVEPSTGAKVTGDAHAPLLYATDPREDLPVDLERAIRAAIADSDGLIVAGWLDRA